MKIKRPDLLRTSVSCKDDLEEARIKALSSIRCSICLLVTTKLYDTGIWTLHSALSLYNCTPHFRRTVSQHRRLGISTINLGAIYLLLWLLLKGLVREEGLESDANKVLCISATPDFAICDCLIRPRCQRGKDWVRECAHFNRKHTQC